MPHLVETFMTYNYTVVSVSISSDRYIFPISIFNDYRNSSTQHIIEGIFEVHQVFYSIFVIFGEGKGDFMVFQVLDDTNLAPHLLYVLLIVGVFWAI